MDSLLTTAAIASGVDEGIISLLIDADAVSKHIHSLSGNSTRILHSLV
jgi:hypothetical protein